MGSDEEEGGKHTVRGGNREAGEGRGGELEENWEQGGVREGLPRGRDVFGEVDMGSLTLSNSLSLHSFPGKTPGTR